MPVAVNPVANPQAGELGALVDAVGLAMNYYGKKLDRDQLADLKAKEDERLRALAGAENQEKTAKRTSDFVNTYDIVPEGTPGAVHTSAIASLLPTPDFKLPPGQTVRPRAYGLEEMKNTATAREKDKDRANELAKARIAHQTANAVAGNKQLTAQQAETLADMSSVNTAIDNLEKQYEAKASAMGSGVTAFFPGSNANNYSSTRKISAQAIGKALEGGKMTDQDRDFYLSMMPSATDTPSQAKAKITELRAYAKNKIDSYVTSLANSGFNTAKIPKLKDTPQEKDSEPGTALAAPSDPAQLPKPPKGKIRVVDAQGNIGLIPADDLQEALKTGYEVYQ